MSPLYADSFTLVFWICKLRLRNASCWFAVSTSSIDVVFPGEVRFEFCAEIRMWMGRVQEFVYGGNSHFEFYSFVLVMLMVLEQTIWCTMTAGNSETHRLCSQCLSALWMNEENRNHVVMNADISSIQRERQRERERERERERKRERERECVCK